MIAIEQLSLRRGPRVLFEEANLQINPGHHVGLVGVNGTGKSSLFALILGQLEADTGSISVPDWRIAHVAQEAPSGSQAMIEFVLDGDQQLRHTEQAIARYTEQNDPKLHEALATMEAIDGYAAASRAARMLSGLGFADDELNRPIDSFSGGWRIRLNLAQALISRSDLLLLDEPTNHLDLPAVVWLEGWLKQYPGTLMLISHDREFLDGVCQSIIAIEQGRVSMTPGNYSAYERIRSERMLQQDAARSKQAKQAAHLQSFVERFRAKASKAKQAQSRLKMLARMADIGTIVEDETFNFRFRSPDEVPQHLMQLDMADLGYDTAIVKQVKLGIAAGDRIGLIGANGNGKSTLIKAIASGQTVLKGERNVHRHTRIGYFAQHSLEQLDAAASPALHLQRLDHRLTDQQIRDHLGGFGFRGARADAEVKTFSGGEKARLVLALLVHQRPNLLLLDEPTNHLDMHMRDGLAMALQEFEGAVIIISHDRRMMMNSCDNLLLLANGRCEPFDGDLEQYLLTVQSPSSNLPVSASDGGALSADSSRRNSRQRKAEQRQRLKPMRERLKRAENALQPGQNQWDELNARLAEPELYQDGAQAETLASLLQDQGALRRQVEANEVEWLEASDALEQALKEIEADSH